MPRLIHLNGPSGAGKSSAARAYLACSPGTLLVDPDTLLASIGKWQRDFWELIPVARGLAAALAKTHLTSGHDVVVPQLCTSLEEVRPFEELAAAVGADYVELHFECTFDTVLARYHAAQQEQTDTVRTTIYRIISGAGGESLMRRICADFERYQALRPDAVRLTVEGESAESLASLVALNLGS